MKICLAGEGAFGNKHLDALSGIEDVEVVSSSVVWQKKPGALLMSEVSLIGH